MSLEPVECTRGNYLVSTDTSRLDLPWTYNFLSNEAYWSREISYPVFEKSVANSLCFGVYHQNAQVGFGRVISDYATFAYLADVFICRDYRDRGLGKLLVECILNHPGLQGLRRWMLVTRDAHDLYRQFGFSTLNQPEKYMEITRQER
ncbi:MAG: GNAT family N-acetyltransferase [Chloroflexota bacterium]|nr:MAG: GNAT family N-acetyltransferase [Chloroflexota bacterium]